MREPQTAPGLYVHLPFCARICPYCDFAVTPLGGDGAARLERYRRALLAEIALRAEAGGPFMEAGAPGRHSLAGDAIAPVGVERSSARGARVCRSEDRRSQAPWRAEDGLSQPLRADTVYFGGGTPSVAPPELPGEIVEAAVEHGLAAPAPFVFVEANPEDVVRAPELAAGWRAAGVSGVSLGGQALDDDRLRFLRREHTAREVEEAASRLAEAGIAWVSLDLIYGTRGQSPAALRRELEAAADLPGVNHLSAYELTIEPGTPFGRRAARGERLTSAPAGGDALFRVVHETLAERGFPAYEVSNFAAGPEFRSRHNRKYWNGVRYLGIGPSAHSFDPERSERSWNRAAFADWEAALLRGEVPTAGRERLGPAERAVEDLFLRLRTTDGLDLGAFGRRYGERVVRRNAGVFRGWEERRLVRLEGDVPTGRLRPTLAGLAVADALAAEVELDGLTETSGERDAA